MHGRVKVRTSEEEKARKEKERQEKLEIFKHAMQKIQSKRKEGELDLEIFNITGKVLNSNPDLYTLWNIRREYINVFRKTCENTEEITKLFDDELQMTEYCLKINPKSYCAWHQREWVLTTRMDPDWKKELALCTNYLQYDERNFHTWDYRRFVVSQSKHSLEDEFNYTTDKIHENFSNYSAWHWRSKLLIELYPDLEGGRPIRDSNHKHELKIVQSAAFTDPDDTSAWFYQRWLLGAVKTDIHIAVCALTKSKSTFAFNKYVSKTYIQSSVKLIINNENISGDWTSCTGNDYDTLWILNHSFAIVEDLDVKVEYSPINNEKKVIKCKQYKPSTYVGKTSIDFQKKYSIPVIEELKEQLKACRQLLALEPDSKWTMFTTTVFLYCIDAKLYHKEIIDNLKALKDIDKLRAGYFNDLITKWSIEQQLPVDYDKEELSFKPALPEKMSCLPHLALYSHCEDVDLSNQSLSAQHLKSLVVLQHCKKLSLAYNNITSLKNWPSLTVEELDLQGNMINKDEVEQLKKQSNINIFF